MSHDDLDRHLDEQLRAAFAPPSPDRLAALVREAAEPPRRSLPVPILLLGAAAALLLAFAIGRWSAPSAAVSSSSAGPAAASGEELGAMWVAAYEDAVERGFVNCGGGGCAMEGFDLAGACRQRFSAPLQVAADAEVEVVGAYDGLPTGGYMTLLTESKNRPVCVFVLPRSEDPKVELPPGKPFHLARRAVGDLVLYALSEVPGEQALGEFIAP
ncbi:MAG TPA: hypothetical protein ENI87_05075 [bacterium]|nr:hypothetical protein [bacterium]